MSSRRAASPLGYLYVPSVWTSHERNSWVPRDRMRMQGQLASKSLVRYISDLKGDPESRSFDPRHHLVINLPAGEQRPLPPARWFQRGNRYCDRWGHVWYMLASRRFGAGALHKMYRSQASRDPHSPPGMRIGQDIGLTSLTSACSKRYEPNVTCGRSTGKFATLMLCWIGRFPSSDMRGPGLLAGAVMWRTNEELQEDENLHLRRLARHRMSLRVQLMHRVCSWAPDVCYMGVPPDTCHLEGESVGRFVQSLASTSRLGRRAYNRKMVLTPLTTLERTITARLMPQYFISRYLTSIVLTIRA